MADTNPPALPDGFVCRTWGTEAGLPQNTVNAMAQTRDGYLWLGTQAGLARFDGVRFKVFGLAEGLPDVLVQSLFADAEGDLWIGTAGGGVCRLHAGKIESFQCDGNSGADNVRALAADLDGKVWIGTKGGLFFWKGSGVFRDEAFARIGRGEIRALLKDRAGVMWVSSANGLFACENGKIAPVIGPPPLISVVAHCLLEDRSGRIWASIGNGKVLCREATGWRVYDRISGLPFAYITCMAEDVEGTIWAGSLDAGLYYFHEGKFNNLSARDGLPEAAIRSLLVDQEGDLWVGHRAAGLVRLTPRKLSVLGAEQGLTHDYVRSVAETTDGQLWVGTTGGGLYYEAGGTLRMFTKASFNSRFPFVETVLATRDGSLWWGGRASLFHWKDDRLAESYRSVKQPVDQPSQMSEWLIDAAVTALQDDEAGGMWIGTSQGEVLHLAEGNARILTNSLARGSVTSFMHESDGTLWVGSSRGGLSRMRGEEIKRFSTADGLASTHVRVLHRTGDGVLWIGTGGSGLVRFQAGEFKTIDARQGLGDDTVSQILEDDQGFLWLGCNRGIFRVRKSELDELAGGRRAFVHPRVFGQSAGMLAEECAGGSCPAACKLKSGRLAFPTVKGVVLIDPQLQAFESGSPKVLVEEVRADRKIRELQRIADAGKGRVSLAVTIPPGRRECEFHYTGLSFKAPERVRFQYQMAGLEQDWVEADARRVAYYNPLPPGDYVFRVRACNAEGVWSDREATLAVTVLPYFWETRWFLVALGLVMLGAAAGTVWFVEQRRFKRHLAELETQRTIERERLRISQDLHDDIGAEVTQLIMLGEMAEAESVSPTETRQQLRRMTVKSRELAQSIDETIWAVNPRKDSLAGLTGYLQAYAAEFFESSPIRCRADMPPHLPVVPLEVPVRHNLLLATKEALHNVAAHSGASEVWLRFRCEAGVLTIVVEDNGRGFDSAKLTGVRNGLVNMRARLEALGGDCEVMSQPGSGACVRFTLPLNAVRIPPPTNIPVSGDGGNDACGSR